MPCRRLCGTSLPTEALWRASVGAIHQQSTLERGLLPTGEILLAEQLQRGTLSYPQVPARKNKFKTATITLDQEPERSTRDTARDPQEHGSRYTRDTARDPQEHGSRYTRNSTRGPQGQRPTRDKARDP